MNEFQLNQELKFERKLLDYLEREIAQRAFTDSTDASKVTPLKNKLTLHSSSEQEIILELLTQRRQELNLIFKLEQRRNYLHNL